MNFPQCNCNCAIYADVVSIDNIFFSSSHTLFLVHSLGKTFMDFLLKRALPDVNDKRRFIAQSKNF
jgi:hypothetical protein